MGGPQKQDRRAVNRSAVPTPAGTARELEERGLPFRLAVRITRLLAPAQ